MRLVSRARDRWLSCLTAVTLSVLILTCAAPTRAELADPADMRQAANNYLTTMVAFQGSWAGVQDPSITGSVDIYTADSRLAARCFYIAPDGYIVVPYLKELPPIQAYSERGALDIETGGYAAIIRETVGDRMARFEQMYGSLEASQPADEPALLGRNHRQLWDRYTVDAKQFAQQLTELNLDPNLSAGPLLTTEWHQSAPYNNYCPMGAGGQRTVVGCVATAYAQVMRYHEWPRRGEGLTSYLWYGDWQCGAPYFPHVLEADFSDEYDWNNMPDHCDTGCTVEQQAALAELSYEVGVATNMNYGTCEGSASYIQNGLSFMPNRFGYRDSIYSASRVAPDYWFSKIQEEIDADRPIVYGIYSHAIVCDGWRIINDLKQYHQNYGWGDSHNQWYTLDELHCPWAGCSPTNENGIFYIKPKKLAVIDADQRIGWAPFEVNFTGYSDWIGVEWTWDFGDGDSAFVQNPTHVYTSPGICDITLQVNYSGNIQSSTEEDFIVCLADSLDADDIVGDINSTVEMTIVARNTIALDMLKIPIKCTGSLTALELVDYSLEGCRTDYFEEVDLMAWDGANHKYAFKLQPSDDGSQPALLPGYGPVFKVTFQITGAAAVGQSAEVSFAGFDSHLPTFDGDMATYTAKSADATIWAGQMGCCLSTTGNVDGDAGDICNIVDMTYLAAYLFTGGPEPPCMDEANVNGSADGMVNIVDMTYLAAYLFTGGAAPVACP